MCAEARARGHAGRVLLAIVAALLLGCGDALQPVPERLVLIVIDTLRRDQMSLYGGPAATPRIAELARQGRALDTAVSSFHQTSMSMGALFTGRTPSLESGDPDRPLTWNAANWCGMARFAGEGDTACLPRRVDTLGEQMRRRGFFTVGVASNPLTFEDAGFRRGFHVWKEVQAPKGVGYLAFSPETLPLWCEQRAGTKVNEAVFAVLERRPHDSFFLYVHYMDAHDWYDQGWGYHEGVERADAAVGELLDWLEAEGLLEGAAILLTADHGEVLEETHGLPTQPRHQGNPSFEPVLRVPLVVKGLPVPDGVVRSEDVPGILRRGLGLPAAPASDGLEPAELLLTEREWRTYRRGRWKSFWPRGNASVFLVDLEADPGEQRDVSDAHPEVVAAHRLRLADLEERLEAPGASQAPVSGRDLENLRALGYVE